MGTRSFRPILQTIVVDASGPFQAYGDSYRMVRAAISRGIDYLDLAGGLDLVKGIVRFGAQARECRPPYRGWPVPRL